MPDDDDDDDDDDDEATYIFILMSRGKWSGLLLRLIVCSVGVCDCVIELCVCGG